ncbi:MAG: hypothetical protein Q3983_05245 [Capnocytophaga sp.]|nr:hypothetical protein [Capnocytophaga sp.]
MENKVTFTSLKTLYLAINFMQLIFIVVICYLVQDSYIVSWDFSNPFCIISLLSCILAVSLQFFVFRKMIYQIENKIFEEKLKTYQNAFIFRLGILEFSTLLCCVFGLITSNIAYLFFALPTLFLSVSLYPSKYKIIEDTKLSADERKRFYKEY